MFEAKLKTVKKIRESVRHASVNWDMLDDPDLTPSDKDLLSILSIMAGEKLYCWPSLKYLCLMMDINPFTNERNIRRRLSKLEQSGYITRHAKFANDNKRSRQTSNTIVINYTCSKHKESDLKIPKYNPWDIVFWGGINDASGDHLVPAFTPPRNNIYINLTKVRENDEKSYTQGEQNRNTHSSLALAGAPATNGYSFPVDRKMFSRPVLNWFKRPYRYYPSRRSGFTHVRSKYGEIGPYRKETVPMNSNLPAEKKELTPREWDEIHDHLGIVIEYSPGNSPEEIKAARAREIEEKYEPNPLIARPPVKETPPSEALAMAIRVMNSCVGTPAVEKARAQKYVIIPQSSNDSPLPIPVQRTGMDYLSTNTVDNSVDRKTEAPIEESSIGGKNIDWKEICSETQKRNITFSSWRDGLTYRFVQNGRMHLSTKNRFWQETCEKRYAGDILNACKFLGLPISWIDITVRE